MNENQFIEYTKEGYPTTFTITAVEPYKRWEFDMENSNMKGHWVVINLAVFFALEAIAGCPPLGKRCMKALGSMDAIS